MRGKYCVTPEAELSVHESVMVLSAEHVAFWPGGKSRAGGGVGDGGGGGGGGGGVSPDPATVKGISSTPAVCVISGTFTAV